MDVLSLPLVDANGLGVGLRADRRSHLGLAPLLPGRPAQYRGALRRCDQDHRL